MAVALVKLGTVAEGTTSASPTFGQATTAGNFLVAWVLDKSSANLVTPTGWSAAVAATGAIGAGVYYKGNCTASETAPVFSDASGFQMDACLAEFYGVLTVSPLNQHTSVSGGLTSPQVVTAPGADAAVGELMCTSEFIDYSMAGTKTTTDTYTNATATAAANNDSTSILSHYRFSYGITTANASADSNSVAFTITSVTQVSLAIASFKAMTAVMHPKQFDPTPFIPKGRSM